MFRVAIIGCGGIGNAHARSWKEIEGVEIAAVCDLNAERAKVAGETYGCPWYTDMKELPKDIDVVSVATHPQAHYPVVKPLLEQGYHVFCEKPLSTNVEECKELDALAKAKGVLLGVGFKMRYESINNEVKKYLPEIGKLVHISTTKIQAYRANPEAAWVTKTGASYELSIHDFDLITFITGMRPQKVLFSEMKHRFGWEADDGFAITVDYGDGVTALLEGMYAVDTTFCFRDFTMTFLGDKGYIRVERPDRIVVHTDAYRVIEVAPYEKSAFVLELEHFKRAAEGKEENTLTAADAISATWLIEEAKAKSI